MQKPQFLREQPPHQVTYFPQPAGVNIAEDEVTDIHARSASSEHHTAEILKKISPLPEGR
jgi:hypothetical protein